VKVPKNLSYSKEKLWREFYLLRSLDFTKESMDFLPITTPPIEPIVYQNLTDLVSKFLLQDHFKKEYLDEETTEMNKNERSVLW